MHNLPPDHPNNRCQLPGGCQCGGTILKYSKLTGPQWWPFRDPVQDVPGEGTSIIKSASVRLEAGICQSCGTMQWVTVADKEGPAVPGLEYRQAGKVKNHLQFVPETITVILEGAAGGPGTVYLDGAWLDPAPSQGVRNHSPDGFMWGYQGSGPAQLALAILMQFLPLHLARAMYQEFKREFVSRWSNEEDSTQVVALAEWVRDNMSGKEAMPV